MALTGQDNNDDDSVNVDAGIDDNTQIPMEQDVLRGEQNVTLSLSQLQKLMDNSVREPIEQALGRDAQKSEEYAMREIQERFIREQRRSLFNFVNPVSKCFWATTISGLLITTIIGLFAWIGSMNFNDTLNPVIGGAYILIPTFAGLTLWSAIQNYLKMIVKYYYVIDEVTEYEDDGTYE